MVTHTSWTVAQRVRTMEKGSLFRIAQSSGVRTRHVLVSEGGMISRSVGRQLGYN